MPSSGVILEAWHINSAHAPLNRDDGGLLPHAYLHLVRKKRPLISDHIKGPLVAAFRSPLMKALDRSVETLGLWIVTSSVTFIKSANQSSIKLCLIVHLVAMWTLIYWKVSYSINLCAFQYFTFLFLETLVKIVMLNLMERKIWKYWLLNVDLILK